MPYLDGLKVLYFAEEAATVMAMQAGDIDIYPVVPLKGGEPILKNPNFTILRHASAEYRSIHIQVDKPPFTDKRVRQGVAYCIDREALVKSLFNGGADIANDHSFAPVYVDTQLANSEVPQRRQDYAKAKELLAAAGMPSVDVTLTTGQYLEMPQYAVPEFVTGIIVLAIFAGALGWLPVSSHVPTANPLDWFRQLLLPSIPLMFVLFGFISRMARVGTVESFRSNYVRTAILKGLARRTVI